MLILRLPVAAILAVLVVTSADCGESKNPRQSAQAPQGPGPIRLSRPLDGRLLVLVGPESGQGTIYEVSRSGKLEPLPAASRHAGAIAGFDARGKKLLYAAATTGPDEVILVPRSGVTGIRLESGFGPALGPKGKVAYVSPRYGERDRSWQVLRVRRGERRGKAYRIVGDFFRPRFTPSGSIVAMHERRGRTFIVLNAGSRRSRRVASGLRAAGQLLVSRRGDMAVGYMGRIIFFDPNGRRLDVHRVPWRPLSWSPDGQRLLVASRRGKLGLMNPTDGSIRAIGDIRGINVYEAGWLAR